MDNSAGILDRLSEGRVAVLAKMASPTADSLLVAEFATSETLYENLDKITKTIEDSQGALGLAVEGVVVAAFSGPSAAVRSAIELQQLKMTPGGLRIAIHSAAGSGISQRGLSQAIALLKTAQWSQVLVNSSVRNAAHFDTDVRCTFIRQDVAEIHWEDEPVTKDLPFSRRPGRPVSLYSAASPKIPDVIDNRFEILGEVGNGGMGIVYKALDREAGETVALKMLRPEIASDEGMMRRFRNELRIARKITHKNVCRIYDLTRYEDHFFISMEFVDGETLRDVLKRFGALGIRKGLQVAEQICAGLHEAHAQGVVHRDLKPENIMFDREGNVRIMDFGIARSTDMQATTMAIVGTPAYMAPEQAQGKTVDWRADIYSLGLILYEIFTGSVAFTGDTPVAVALKHVVDRPTPPRKLDPSLPQNIEQAILRCLEKNPDKRFQSVDELEKRLLDNAFWTPAPASLTAAERPQELRSWQKSDWHLLLIAALATLAAILIFPAAHPAETLRAAVNPAAANFTQLEQAVTAALHFLAGPPRRVLFTVPLLLLFVMFMFVRRGLHRQAPVPATLRLAAVIGLGAAAAIPISEYTGPGATAFMIGMPLLAFFLTFIVAHCVITIVLHYGQRRCPMQVSGYLLFLNDDLFSPVIGLDMVRGILAGLCFVGFWLAAMLAVQTSGLAFIGFPFWLQKSLLTTYRSYFSDFLPVLMLAETLIVTWILVAFPMTVFAGGISKLRYLLAGMALLWAVLGFSLAGALTLPPGAFEVSAALQAAFMGFVFHRYGITSVGAAILTIEVFLLALPLLRTFDRVQPWLYSIPFAVWILTALGSTLMLLRPQLAKAYRRASSMLE